MIFIEILLSCNPKISSMKENQSNPMFDRGNYMWMLVGILVIAAGMILMSGGRSNADPSRFDKDAVYSTTRITIAPILILAGLVIEIFAIFRKQRPTAA
jgi:hypothetical protein